MNIPGKVASTVLILIGLGWLVSLFGGSLFGNRAANNLAPDANQAASIAAKQAPLTTSNFNAQKLTTATVPPNTNQVAQATASPTASATPAPTTSASSTPAAAKSPEFEQSPRAVTSAVPATTAATPSPAPTPAQTVIPATEPVRAGW
jgi:hypothetical protein